VGFDEGHYLLFFAQRFHAGVSWLGDDLEIVLSGDLV
jgi:hypothetical protein